MDNILFCGYRDWSHKLFLEVENTIIDYFCVYVDDKELLNKMIEEYEPKFIFFIGWSWIVDKSIVNDYKCICLHPSPLPKYRGGSPIQHQIINGEKDSAVTLILMDDGLDTGDILYQKKFSLKGNLNDIYNRIIDIGGDGVIKIIDEGFKQVKQDENEATYYKRRKPSMSEIRLDDFKNCTSKQLYDKIRALQDPYPNAYIRCKDGRKLFLTESRLEDRIEDN